MGLKLSVKIGDVTNLSDARYAAGMGVDYIGFNINSSSANFVSPSIFKEITNWVSGVGIIGEIGDTEPANKSEYPAFLSETTDASNLIEESVFRVDATQLSIDSVKNLLPKAGKAVFTIIELTTAQIESSSPELATLCADWPIYISAKFSEDLLEAVVEKIKPQGIEIKGGIEDQPGFKDYDGIADVLEWLEEDD